MKRRTNRTVLFSLFLLLPLMISAISTAAEKKEVVKSETGFYYTIQKGDTLWDLSKQFSDSPWLWPELWKENDQISNPHWIFPGERIRLYQKAGTQVISKSGPTPRDMTPPTPAAEKKASAYFVYSAIDRVGFIRKPPVTPSGTILAVQGSKVLISEGDIVYIQPSENAPAGIFIPGSQLTVFKLMAPTKARDSRETIGTQHYILGIVEVTRKTKETVTAKVLKSYRPIHVNDLLMPFRMQPEKIDIRPSTPGIDGQIISSEDHTKLTGDYMVAFINKGRADNIEAGQLYSIYARQKVTPQGDEKDIKLLPPVDFGTLFVLHTEQTTSTVVITDAQNSVSPGQKFRTPID